MPDLLELVRAVDLGCFEQFHVDSGNGGQVEDCSPSHALPHADQRVGCLPVRAVSQERNALIDPAQSQQRRVDDTGLRAEDLQHHTADNDPAQEVRQVQQCLGYFLNLDAFHLIQQDCQDDRHRETGYQAEEVQPQGILEGYREVRHIHHEPEVLQSDPFASPHALEHVEFLETDDNTHHRLIAEDQVKSHRQDQHDV